MYENGRGFPQNYAQAALWYKRAAAQGHADAENNLGLLYMNGQGVPQNRSLAIAWYRRAAAHGSREAQQNLNAIATDTVLDVLDSVFGDDD